MSGDMLRLCSHPTERAVYVVKIPSTLNEAMGTFSPAREAFDLGGYLVLDDHVPALYRWARFNDVRIIDERGGKRNAGPQRPPVECRHCAQPGSMTNQPRRCPACGEEWQPIPPPVRKAPRNLVECPACNHKQTGSFPFCSACGADMPLRPTVVSVRTFGTQPPREHLDDPLPFGQVVNETLTLHDRARIAEVGQGGRPVEDVPLPATDEEVSAATRPLAAAPAEPPPADDEPPSYDPWAVPETSNPEPDDRVLCAYHESQRYHDATCLSGCGGPMGGGCARVAADQEPRASDGQLTSLHILFDQAGITDRDDKLGYCASVIDHDVESTKDLTRREYAEIRSQLQRIVNAERLAEHRRTGALPRRPFDPESGK